MTTTQYNNYTTSVYTRRVKIVLADWETNFTISKVLDFEEFDKILPAYKNAGFQRYEIVANEYKDTLFEYFKNNVPFDISKMKYGVNIAIIDNYATGLEQSDTVNDIMHLWKRNVKFEDYVKGLYYEPDSSRTIEEEMDALSDAINTLSDARVCCENGCHTGLIYNGDCKVLAFHYDNDIRDLIDEYEEEYGGAISLQDLTKRIWFAVDYLSNKKGQDWIDEFQEALIKLEETIEQE